MKKIRIDFGILVVSLSGMLMSVWLILSEKSGTIVDVLFIILLGIVFLVAMVIVIDRGNWRAAKVGGVLAGVILLLILCNTDIYKSPIVLEAHLKDDLSGMHLCLRENGKFEMVSSYLYGTETFTGRYQIQGDKIHFLDPTYSRDYIPSTVTIWQNKIILEFDKEGQPNLNYGKYFDIINNKFDNAP